MNTTYEAVPSDESEEKTEATRHVTTFTTALRPYVLGVYAALISAILLSVLLIDTVSSPSAVRECSQPAFRREWRTLDDDEKRGYIKAVQCMRNVRSRVGTKYSLYEDFAYVHAQGSGIRTHNTASFLAWHRFYLQIYEDALKKDCGYRGNLPYWDWTKDLHHIYDAPIWGSDELSFGTNGTGDRSPVPGELRGSCVTDGPFANMTLHYLGLKEHEHCFSRGFAAEELLHNLTSWLRPQIIEKLLLMPRYQDFNDYLERYTHLAIPGIIQGDLVTFTSPNDPVLFLHHAQLDRLWSTWQRLGAGRTDDYGGNLLRDVPSSQAAAHSDDILHADGLASDVSVKDILNTRKGRLCYEYD